MNIQVVTNSPTCPACGSNPHHRLEHLELREQFGLYAKGDETVRRRLLETAGLDFDSYDIFACPHCGLHFSHPLAAPSGEWYAYTYNQLQMHAGYRWEFDYVATKLGVADHVGEIGCGTGVFLEKCVARKADAFGVDFSESSVARCHEKGLSAALIKVGQDEISLPGSRNVIASFHVLEHLPDPGNLFTLASRCASPEATLWVAVPSDRRVDRLFCRKDLLDEPPHHLTKWTPAALRSIGHRNGWAMRQVIYEAMPLRQRLWTICRATTVYRQLAAQLGADANSGGRERLLRFALYPFVLTWHWRRVIRLTGASMLAEFCRSPITCSH